MEQLKKYKKTRHQITAEKVAPGTKLHNYLENANYTTDKDHCIKLTGTVGEDWVVTIDKLAKTYTHADGTAITAANIPVGPFKVQTIVGENAPTVWAKQTTEQIEVQTSWATLQANAPGVPHGAGDYIVYDDKDGQPNLQKCRVVNGLVFPNTYEPV